MVKRCESRANDDVYASFNCKVAHTFNPEVAEALALRKAMLLCEELGFPSMIFEGDCLSVVHMINSISTPYACVRLVIFDIQQLFLSHPLWHVVFIHIKKVNMVAHHLARLACSISFDLILVDECLDNVLSYVIFDKPCITTI